MELTAEFRTAAHQLGQSLRQDNHLCAYLDALEESRTNPETSALEKKMYDEYEALIDRQQTSETLTQEDTRSFYELHQQVQNHPLLSKRNDMLQMVRPYLAAVAEEISLVLGVDYVALAKPR